MEALTAFVYVIGFLASVFGGVPLVYLILDRFELEGNGNPKAGMTIGIFERAIVTALVFVHAYSAIGLVLAAKSIARFESLKEREFAEYYLIGTLASLSIGIIVGLLALEVVRVV